MCGFVAVLGKPIEKNKIQNALELIRHRGPDDTRIWQDEKFNISLGHVRLSIIDLEGGAQPITNHDDSLAVVVNGEFYDYRSIRDELAADGYQFKTESDSEIILGLYERFGTRALKFLRGEFAFVLWDRKNRLVLAARDYFGIKPLFYAQDEQAIYFASEAKALRSLGLRLELSEENLVQTMCLFPNPEETLFKGVYQIPPAHSLISSLYGKRVSVRSYWDFNYPKGENLSSPIAEDDAIEGLRAVLFDSIKTRLRADVPVACYLSGGLDSCSILGIAQSMSKKPIKAFTLTFDHASYDEEKVAREMAAFAHAEYFPIPISQDDIAGSFEDAVWHAERFLINGHAVAKFLLSKAVNRAGVKVVLTGEGSDEIFGGYPFFRQDKIEHAQEWSSSEKAQLMNRLFETNEVSNALLLAQGGLDGENLLKAQLGFAPSWLRNFGKIKSHVWDLFAPSIKSRYGERNLMIYALNCLDIAGQIDGRDNLSKSLYIWSKIMLPYYLLTVLGDRMEMAHSVEGRVPFLDHKVVEYVVSLPSHFKIKELTEKYILRKAAEPYVTPTIFQRQKHPFLAPPSSLAHKDNSMSALIQDTLRSFELRRLSFIDANKVTMFLDGLATMPTEQKTQFDALLLTLVSCCLLNKRLAN